MTYKRKDKGCSAKVLAVVGERVLIEAKWDKNRVNILFVNREYFNASYNASV